MKTSRRELAAMVALGGTALSIAPAKAATQPQLVHHVFFWLKRPGSQEDRDKLVAGLRTLRDIPVIRKLLIGLPADTERRSVIDASYDVSELMYFDNAQDQKAYQDHPIHLAFVKSCSDLWDKLIVYDMNVVA